MGRLFNMTKIITCNQNIVDKLIQNGQMPEHYLAENYERHYKNFKTNFPIDGKFFYDRSGTIPHYMNVDSNKNPIPITDSFNLSFSEVVEKRAKELLALGKPINVSWSGGLDSTFILFTLRHYANDPSQIKVYGTYSSIIESGYMFDKYIKNNFKYDIHTNTSYENNYKNIPDDEIIVTGSPGNDIFYKDIGEPNKGASNKYDSWMKFRNPVSNSVYSYADSPYEKVLDDSNLEFLEEFVKKSPRKIETLQDLRWWVCFCFNWYTTLYNNSVGVGSQVANKTHAFYNTDDFQLWSMYNKDLTTKVGDYSDDRWQLREMIAEYTGDDFYAAKKTNFLSVLSTFGDKWLFLMNDYSNVYVNDIVFN
jgi:hypothetical protein